jgi:signal transduction histidine kinase
MARIAASSVARLIIGLAGTAWIVAWYAPLADSLGTGRVVADIAASIACLAGGLMAARHRPANPIWIPLILFGLVGLGREAAFETLVPWRFTAGLAVNGLGELLIAYIALTFPSGRLQGRWPRALFVLLAVAVLGWKPFELAWTPPGAVCATCPPAGNLFFTGSPPYEVHGFGWPLDYAFQPQDYVLAALLALVLATLAVRWLRATGPARRVLGPVLFPVAALAAKLVLDTLVFDDLVTYQTDRLLLTVIPDTMLVAAVPAGVLVGLLRSRITRSAVGDLVVELSNHSPRRPLQDLLAKALGDPGLQLGLWAEPLGRYVDAAGRPFQLPERNETRVAASYVSREDGPLAVLVHDSALDQEPGLVEAVGAAARLALENERLKAEVKAQLAAVSESRARIVTATDSARRRIERDLHDGAQQRLVSLEMALQLVDLRAGDDDPELRTMVADARAQARRATEELRDLARGIHPSVLTEGGLAAALESLACRAPIEVALRGLPERRFPAPVEVVAYYFCSEAVTNAAKHAGVDTVEIDAQIEDALLALTVIDSGRGGARIGAGSGLTGLVDRVEALGGRIEMASPAGQGTRIKATLPISEPSEPPPA